MASLTRLFTFFSLAFLLSFSALGQVKNLNKFINPVDRALTVRTLVIVPVEDNVSGIYAKPIEEHLRNVLSKDPQWSASDLKTLKGFNLDSLYTSPEEVKKITHAAQADALLKVRLTKGPHGINSRMTLFSGQDGLPMAEENLENYKRFEVSEVKQAFEDSLKTLRSRLPYRGEVLSRRGQEITINAGKNFDIKPGSDISLIQILKVHRHPKFNFIVASEREILGKARVFKVDDTLSFAHITLERDSGVIQPGTKMLPDEYIRYSEPYITPSGEILTDLSKRKDKDVSYGEQPTEWLPDHTPQYGKASVLAGFTQYTQNADFTTVGTVEGSNNFAPTLGLNGEFWISPAWYASLNLRSSAFAVPNELPGATKDNINMTLNSYHLMFGHNYLLSPDFFGPKIQVGGGFAKFSSRPDSTSPVVFTNMEFGGLVFHFAGQFPVGDVNTTDVGFKFNYYWNPTVTESPSSGGAGDVKINDFAFFFNIHAKPKFSYIGELRFENYSANFSEGGDRTALPVDSINHKLLIMMFGVEFQF